jgi:DNA-binding CsgD family transcriptional regulator
MGADLFKSPNQSISQGQIQTFAMETQETRAYLDGRAVRDRRIRVVASRVPPVMIILDLDLRVLGWSPNSGAERLIASAGTSLREAVERCHERAQQVVHVVDEDTLLRIVPLDSSGAACVGVLVERFGSRGPLVSAAKTYRLTKREMEILNFVFQGMSNSEIAEALYIAHSTVADHIKSLMRKTQTTKRVHLISKLMNGEGVIR